MTEAEKFEELPIEYVSLPDYLKENPGRVTIEHNQQYDLDFYRISRCACIGSLGQYIAPLGPGGTFKQVLNESFISNISEQEKNIVGGSSVLEDFVHLERAVALYPLWSNTFWHWCMECLPKLLVLESMGYDGPYLVPQNRDFITQSLVLLGIGQERIIYNTACFLVDSLILPQNFYGRQLVDNLPLLELLRNSLLGAVEPHQGPERLYLPRLQNRKVANEDELLPLLREHGFKIVLTEDLPFAQQIQVMQNVNLSLMAHGAASFLTLFQKMNSYRIELFSNSYTHYHSMPMIKLLNLRYIPIVESYLEPFELEDHRKKQTKDIVVPIPLFKAILENVVKNLDN